MGENQAVSMITGIKATLSSELTNTWYATDLIDIFKPEKNDRRKDMKNNKYILLTNTARNIVTARKKSEEIQIARILNRAVSPPITTKTNILAVK
ncbi:hypothetical protein [Photorhabdus thracensis]|uniref:hypothetical protein n=1 Tax=Photorhabdus thracensis TaxID=230089 RepID=UPI0009E46EB0|nr:hypothetical protein [Photorhabdus thracensis]